jgi:hypothetical protein
MPLPEHLIAEFERIRKNLSKEIEMMEVGRMTTGQKSEHGPWIPTTERLLEEAKASLAEMERILRDAKKHMRPNE